MLITNCQHQWALSLCQKDPSKGLRLCWVGWPMPQTLGLVVACVWSSCLVWSMTSWSATTGWWPVPRWSWPWSLWVVAQSLEWHLGHPVTHCHCPDGLHLLPVGQIVRAAAALAGTSGCHVCWHHHHNLSGHWCPCKLQACGGSTSCGLGTTITPSCCRLQYMDLKNLLVCSEVSLGRVGEVPWPVQEGHSLN